MAQVDEHAAQIISVTAVDDQQSTDAIHTAPGIMTTADSLLSVPGEPAQRVLCEAIALIKRTAATSHAVPQRRRRT